MSADRAATSRCRTTKLEAIGPRSDRLGSYMASALGQDEHLSRDSIQTRKVRYQSGHVKYCFFFSPKDSTLKEAPNDPSDRS
jgi:hypothetical protein